MASYGFKASPLCSDPSSSSTTDHSFEHISTGSSRRSSLILVELDKNPLRVEMPVMGERAEDISAVMTEVLRNLERIVEHFRVKGENDAANRIAQNTIATVDVFNETITPWDIGMAMMPAIKSSVPQSRSSGTVSNIVPPPQTSVPTVTSWAAVAAVAPAKGNKLIKFTPDDTLQMTVQEIQVVPVVTQIDSAKRVVWIRGWSAHKPMSEITDRIGQGPVYSMAYSENDTAVCVIFQYAHSAKSLLTDDKQYEKNNGISRFGPGCDVVEGLPFPDNDDIQRMMPPLNERRRLTFARSQLFTHGMTEERFKSDIYSIVGQKNVELVWLFNTGNATVILSAVPLARLVRNEFIRISKTLGSPYKGVIITFSHDPCERPMTLVTQIQNGRPPRPATTYGRSGVTLPEIMTKGRSSSRRNTVHEVDGWQTVGRRR